MSVGKSDLQVSTVALGTWAIGGGSWWGVNDDNESIRTIREGVERGVNLIDTAPVYGFGHSEEVVGKAIAPIRQQVIISTKCGLMFDRKEGSFFFERDGFEVYRNLTKSAIKESVEQSLKRLQTDYIDILFTHWQSIEPFMVSIEETMEALMELKKEGKIRAIGGSNMSPWHIEEYCKHGELDIIQEKYSILDRRIEKEILPVAEKKGITFQAYSPLEQGLLTGKIKSGYVPEPGTSRDGKKWYKKENLEHILKGIEAWKPLCNKYGCSLGNLAIAWVAGQSESMNVLCGARKIEQLEDNAKASEIILEASDREFMKNTMILNK